MKPLRHHAFAQRFPARVRHGSVTHMRNLFWRCAAVLALCALVVTLPTAVAQDWPQFRGAGALGVSEKAAPTEFDVPPNKNVLWQTPVPGLGLSSPVLHSGKIFITTAVSERYSQNLKTGLYGDIKPVDEPGPFQWKVLCLDQRTGKLLWDQTAHTGTPEVKRHPKSSHANPTCATDGKRLVAFFGSEGIFCYDLDGKLIWKKDFGLLDSGFFVAKDAQWGFASSPVLHDGKVIVQCDVQEGSFVACLDANDGKEIWRAARQDVPTWSTPAVVTHEGRTQVVCNGFKEIAGYDFATGKQLWTMKGLGDIPTPTPIFAHGLIFITSAHGPGAPLYAVKPDATGDISLEKDQKSNEFVAWSEPRGGNYMQTPIVVGDLLFACMDNGLLRCYDAKTGTMHYRERLGGATGFTASPVAVGNKLYFTAEDGQVYVVEPGKQFKLIATNNLGAQSMATPAATDGVIYFRTRTHLIAVGNPR